jgi:hypothetical protein
VPGLLRSSAEVITEDPQEDGSLAPLADLGTVNFLTSTVNGSSLGSQHPTQIVMVGSGGGAEEVTASPISSGGAFSSSGPLPGGGACAGKPDCDGPQWEPAQYGSNQAGSADACLAAFTGATSVAYRWEASGEIKSPSTSTYTIPASLVGETLWCSVTASDGTGSLSGTSSGAIVTAAGSGVAAARKVEATAAPAAARAAGTVQFAWEPLLRGTVQVGRTVSCAAAFAEEDSITYTWLAGVTPIGGATTSSYKIPGSLIGQRLSCAVTAANMIHSVSGTSSPATVALGRKLVAVKKPALSGPHEPGKAEKVTAGTWSPKAAKVTYQWYLGSAKVNGATKPTFTVPKAAKKGIKIHCVVTASAVGYATGEYATASVKIS